MAGGVARVVGCGAAAVAAALLLAPPASASFGLRVVAPPTVPAGEPVFVEWSGVAPSRSTRLTIGAIPAHETCPERPPYFPFDRAILRLVRGEFNGSGRIPAPSPPQNIVLCGWLHDSSSPEVYATASRHVVIALPGPRIDAPEEVRSRTGSGSEVRLTGIARAPHTRLRAWLRPGVAPCDPTPGAEARRPGATLAGMPDVAGDFAVTLSLRPTRVGPHRLCAFLVEPQTEAPGLSREIPVHVDDGVAPTAVAVPSFGTAGRPSRLYFVASDPEGPASARVTVTRDGQAIAAVTAPATRSGARRSVVWRPPTGLHGTLRFCATARDAAGNEATRCASVVVRTRWACGEPTPDRRAGRCDRPWALPRGASATGFVRCGRVGAVEVAARWMQCAAARTVYGRWRSGRAAGWACSAPLRQCVAPWPRESYVVWR